MKKLAFLLLLAVALFWADPVYPFDPEKALNMAVEPAGSLACGPDRASVFTAEDGDIRIFLLARTKLTVIIDFKESKVYFGAVSLKGDSVALKTIEEMDIQHAREKYPSPCDFLAPKEA